MTPKILIVDDREDNLLAIESILIPDGYQIIKAASGRDALRILLNEIDFALILMDVKMPNLNGFETAELIYERKRLRHIPIVFITAQSFGEENLFKGYKTGAVDYLYKPINPDILKVKVGVFLELYKKNHALMKQEQKLITINKSLEIEIKEHKASEEHIRALNLELLQSIDRLESVNKELDQFAFMASHDLQEPLRKIRLFSDRLYSKYQDRMDEEGKLYLSRIQRSSERMQSLIQDILAFSKISFEKEAFRETDLNVVFNDALVDLNQSIQDKNAQLLVDKLPVLTVISGLMVPLFNNIINNALKYSRKDVTPCIKVYAEKQMVDENSFGKDGVTQYCRIFFEDNGIGFEQKYAEQIFGVFKRLHTHSEYEGTGIGLALCKKIVEEHHGYISAKGNPGVGSVFIVSLPIFNTSIPLATQKNEPNSAKLS